MSLFDHQLQKLDSSELRKIYQENVFVPWYKQKDAHVLHIKHAHGVYITLEDDTKLLDMKSQAFCANLGHAHEGMIKAITDAAKDARVMSSDTLCTERLALALDLKKIAPKNTTHSLVKTFFTLGGAEANENAIKVARMITKRHKIITRYRSYHGATLATINMSGDYRRIAVDNAMSGIIRFPDPYVRGSGQVIDTVRLLEEIIEIEGAETIAAIMLEGITGANGVFIPPHDYWPRIRALCDHYGIILIADEVLSGFFRTGRWFAIDHFNVVPDIMTLSKGLTAGYMPLGAMMVNPTIADYFNNETLWGGLTQYGHRLSCASARAALSFYEDENIGANVKAREEELKIFLNNLMDKHDIVGEVRSIGLLAAIDLVISKKSQSPLVPYRAQGDAYKAALYLQQALKEEGISALVRYNMIVIAPPLIINKDELHDGMARIDKALFRLKDRLALL
jgi:taurine--2-oxoglutarate transaminase